MRANRIRTPRTWFINYGLVNQGRFTRRATVPTAIVLRWSSQAQVTLDYFSAGPSGLKGSEQKGKGARADEMEAQRGARPNLTPSFPKADPKTANAKLDRLQVADEKPNGPPQSPVPRNTDA
jgi:hypothetical protein